MDENEIRKELLRIAFLTEEGWWVCRMHGGGYFGVMSLTKPAGELVSREITIAADRYDVIYGPCTQDDFEAFLSDMEG